MVTSTFTITVTNQGDGMLGAHVEELPGCFASGADMNELLEALGEVIGMYLMDDPDAGHVAASARYDAHPPTTYPTAPAEAQGMRILVQA